MRLRTIAFAAAALFLARAQAQPTEVTLPQGWTPQDVRNWHEATQGSRLLPLAWLLALEQPGSEVAFLDPTHVAKLGYIPSTTSAGLDLPVGFAIDRRDESNLTRTHLRWRNDQRPQEDWVGLNCSACHTAQITYRGRTMQVEGGPGMGDFQTLIERLNESLDQTLGNADKWDRFASKVLSPGRGDTPLNRSLLRGAVAQLAEWQAQQHRMNDTPLRYGPGRLDAFGHIFNKVALIANASRPTPNPADAPVSYPFLWNIHQLPKVQYNGIAKNDPVRSPLTGATFDVGALGRNVGEVVGVFGDVDVPADPGYVGGYASSVDGPGLVALEQQLMRLEPPRWPAQVFGTPDPQKVDAGRQLFHDHCQECHVTLTDLKTRAPDKMSFFNDASAGPGQRPNVKPGTDIWMACNAYTAQTATGFMEGLPTGYIPFAKPLGPESRIATMLETVVPAILAGQKLALARSASETYFVHDLPPVVITPRPDYRLTVTTRRPLSDRQVECERNSSALLGYKSRPLNGIWATPPYLHNGSVSSLYELLLPPAQRRTSLRTGTREFDPVDVGFSTAPDAPGNIFTLETQDSASRPKPGNSNAGHDYGNAGFAEEQRRAIIEFLKTN